MNDTVKPLPSVPMERGDIPQKEQRRRHSHLSEERNTDTTTEKKVQGEHIDHRTWDEEREIEDDEYEFYQHFEREKVKGVIHQITSALKERGIDTEYLMIPFRPEQTNEKLLRFLNQIFPMGNGQPVNEKLQTKIIGKTEVWTLFQGLKYIWCRLPNAEVVGWKSYLEFKYREADKNYPQKAFLEIMPQCLESANHASIVYDFFDLIVTLASNASVNKLSARKISKMCAVWAFSKPLDEEGNPLQNYDFDYRKNNSASVRGVNNSFQDGLNQWIPASDAMFHLLLSFLKSFVPKDLDSSVLPRSLKSVLFNNEYPPKQSTAYNSETILTIPLVTLNTDHFSRKPWQLLERCNELLDFSDYDAFEAREDYALLKSLFKKKNNIEGISRKMSQESRRLMKLLSTKHSTFQAGWARRKCLENVQELKEYIKVKRVDIDDYFIWAWLSTLSYEETPDKRKIFGRSLILEFEFDGFKKWVAFQESDIVLNYNRRSQLKNKRKQEEAVSRGDLEVSPNVLSPKLTSSRENSSPLASPDFPPGFNNDRNDSFHTIITKEALHKNGGKNGKHNTESKMSRWNPLNTLKKKSGNTGKSPAIGTPELSDGGRFSKESERSVSGTNSQRIPSEDLLLSSRYHELPPIDVGGSFVVDIPDFEFSELETPVTTQAPEGIDDNTTVSRKALGSNVQPDGGQRRTTSVAQEMEELSQMVEHMMGGKTGKKQETSHIGTHFSESVPGVSEGYAVRNTAADELHVREGHPEQPQHDETFTNTASKSEQFPRIPRRPVGHAGRKESEKGTNHDDNTHPQSSSERLRVYPQHVVDDVSVGEVTTGRPESTEILLVRLSEPISHRSIAQSEQILKEQDTPPSSFQSTHPPDKSGGEHPVSHAQATPMTSTDVPQPQKSKVTQKPNSKRVPPLPSLDRRQEEKHLNNSHEKKDVDKISRKQPLPEIHLQETVDDSRKVRHKEANKKDNTDHQRHISPLKYQSSSSPRRPYQIVSEGPYKPPQSFHREREGSHGSQNRPENLAPQPQIELQPQPQLQQQVRPQRRQQQAHDYQQANNEYNNYYHVAQRQDAQLPPAPPPPQMGNDMYSNGMEMASTYGEPYLQQPMDPQYGYYNDLNEYYYPYEQGQQVTQVPAEEVPPLRPPRQQGQQKQQRSERTNYNHGQNSKPRAPSPLRQNYQQIHGRRQQQQQQPYEAAYPQEAYMPPPVAPFSNAAGFSPSPGSSPGSSPNPNSNFNPQVFGSSPPVFGFQNAMPSPPPPPLIQQQQQQQQQHQHQPQMAPRYAMKQPVGENYTNVRAPQTQPGPGYRGAGSRMYGAPIPASTVPMTAPHATAFNRLHGNANKKLERRQLYDELRTGNFGI